MNATDQLRTSSCRDYQRKRLIVSSPRPHDGVRNALVCSFATPTAIPTEFMLLLERIR